MKLWPLETEREREIKKERARVCNSCLKCYLLCTTHHHGHWRLGKETKQAWPDQTRRGQGRRKPKDNKKNIILFQKHEYIRISRRIFLSMSLPLYYRLHHPGPISLPYFYSSLHFWESLALLCKSPVSRVSVSSTLAGDTYSTNLSCDSSLARSSIHLPTSGIKTSSSQASEISSNVEL
jgi:hypothetical protein